MTQACPFCATHLAKARIIHKYENWNLFLQSKDKRQRTKQGAGFLALAKHTKRVSEISDKEWLELKMILQDASQRLCAEIGVTYTGDETIGFNQGALAGQTVDHAHVHILPVAEEDPDKLKIRGGIGGAFEALRRERL